MNSIYEKFGHWATSLPEKVCAEYDPHCATHWSISGADESTLLKLKEFAARLFPGKLEPVDLLLSHLAFEINGLVDYS